jgi:hypothetical protein
VITSDTAREAHKQHTHMHTALTPTLAPTTTTTAITTTYYDHTHTADDQCLKSK